MDLNTLWFVLIAVLFIGFFILEGFDYGVGILLPFLGKEDRERRQIINAIGPFWDGNEVWILTGGGAIFAAFPHWYATMFSGFYLALFLLLVALIVRAVAFEFRSKDKDPRWRGTWDWMIFFGSAVPALLWGVTMGNFLRGVPIDADKNFVGGFFDLLNPYTLMVMSIVALIFIPIVLAYQGWTYWVFRQRVTLDKLELTRPDVRSYPMPTSPSTCCDWPWRPCFLWSSCRLSFRRIRFRESSCW